MSSESAPLQIEKIPDYSRVKRLAEVLWHKDRSYRGAAVLIGAGFSRMAGRTGDVNRAVPLWGDFSRILSEKLGSKTSDPLRIAQEYSASNGKAELDALIRECINDKIWEPSEMHSSLLNLPWIDVLTTNWDTLLERASESVNHRQYDTVIFPRDLARTRSPRIVKLHGTIDKTEDLVFTQEDYRSYPDNYAEFVNYSRQVFIENELCLLGFSGDDPNFLSWVGWVRDRLSSSARQIYLVGVLELSASKRKYLESINISPIELDFLVSDIDDIELKHRKANEFFLDALKTLKPKNPWEWEINASTIDIDHLKTQREAYPGWLICPDYKRSILFHQCSNLTSHLERDASKRNPQIIYELLWLYSVIHEIIPEWLYSYVIDLFESEECGFLTNKEQFDIAVILLKNYGFFSLEIKQKDRILSFLKGKEYQYSDVLCHVKTNQLWALLLDYNYAGLSDAVNDFNPKQPIDFLKKAFFLGELNLFDEGLKCAYKGYRILVSQFKKDQNSLYLKSRLHVYEGVLREIDFLHFEPSNLLVEEEESGCDYWSIKRSLNSVAEKRSAEFKNIGITYPLFDPGYYRDNSKGVAYWNSINPSYDVLGITASAGIPFRWEHSSVLSAALSDLAYLKEIPYSLRVFFMIHSCWSESDENLDRVLGWVNIANESQESINQTIDQLFSAVVYWSKQIRSDNKSEITTQLRVYIEVLSRFSTRATVDKAKEIFSLGLSLGHIKEIDHFWIFESLKHLLDRSLKSIPISEQDSLLSDCLSFPLAREKGITRQPDLHDWPNPVIDTIAARDANITSRVSSLIRMIKPGAVFTSSIMERLLPLIRSGFLTDTEREMIADKVWGQSPDCKKLPNIGMRIWCFAEIPSGDDIHAHSLIRSSLFENIVERDWDDNYLYSVIESSRFCKFTPSKDEALRMFLRFVDIRKSISAKDGLQDAYKDERERLRLVADALAKSVVPHLGEDQFTHKNYSKLIEFYRQNDESSILKSIVYFTCIDSGIASEVEHLIKNGLLFGGYNERRDAAHSILIWYQRQKSEESKGLVDLLITVLSYRNAPKNAAMWWTTHQLYLSEGINPSKLTKLVSGMISVFEATKYDVCDQKHEFDYGINLTSIPDLRACIVIFAHDLLKRESELNEDCKKGLEDILEQSKTDALPELRFALENRED